MTRIFINYRRQDSEGYVGRLFDHLTRHFDAKDVFMDVDSIPPGADFLTVLGNAVAACDVFISVIGPQWVTIRTMAGARRLDNWNDFVRVEIASALKQDKMVIPVLVGQAQMPAPTVLPEDLVPLARRNAIELSHNRFAYDADKLVTAIKSLCAAQSAQQNSRQRRSGAAQSRGDQSRAARSGRRDRARRCTSFAPRAAPFR